MASTTPEVSFGLKVQTLESIGAFGLCAMKRESIDGVVVVLDGLLQSSFPLFKIRMCRSREADTTQIF